MLKLWVVRGGKEGEQEDFALSNGRAVIGWDEVPDLTDFADRNAIEEHLQKAKKGSSAESIRSQASELWDFRTSIQEDDQVILPLKDSPFFAFGVVKGPYEYKKDFPDGAHHSRVVDWNRTDVPRADLDEKAANAIDRPPTVYQIKDQEAIENLVSVAKAPAEARYMGIWPMPGESYSYVDTAKEILKHASESTGTYQQLREWCIQRFNLKSGTTIDGYLRILERSLSLMQRTDDKVVLSQRGKQFLAETDPLGLLTFLENVKGFKEIVSMLTEGPSERNRIHERLRSLLGVDWETPSQTDWRLRWLISAKVVKKVGKLYELALAIPQEHLVKIPPYAAPPPSPKRPKTVHIVLKYIGGPSMTAAQVIESHKSVSDSIGYVWWGKDGVQIPRAKIAMLKRQVETGANTFVFFATGGRLTYRARLLDIEGPGVQADKTHVPEYYATKREAAWFKVRDLQGVDHEKAAGELRLASSHKPVNFSGRTSYYYVVFENEPEPTQTKPGVLSMSSTPRNIILYGPVGTGKTYLARKIAYKLSQGQDDEELRQLLGGKDKDPADFPSGFKQLLGSRIYFVTFHKSYSYEQFVIGITATTDLLTGQIKYVVQNGTFKAICEVAKDNPTQNYVLLIDEINRADISKVFGELITLLEEDKRIGMSNEILVRLPYRMPDGTTEKFGIPPNLFIVGTMNTTDRSIALLDIALRRRFRFYEIRPNYEFLDGLDIDPQVREEIKKTLMGMNNRISVYRGTDFAIGHVYFRKIGGSAWKRDLRDVWYNQVMPLLMEYFYEDYKVLKNKILNETNFVHVLDKKDDLLKAPQPVQVVNLDYLEDSKLDAFYQEFVKIGRSPT